jgi:cytochrome c6
MKRQFIVIAIAILMSFLILQPALAAEIDPIPGARIFHVHCAGCHPGGGNIIRRGKTLKQRALQRNGYDSVAAIASLVTHGKNNMSAFADRLTASEIEAVSTYVLEQAAANWPSP